jgi:2-(1,2-epoxy-1,2-dihydrophenyl)acetyl-CoA isomerase
MELTVSDAGPVRVLAIDRPDRLNAMTTETAAALESALARAIGDDVAAVVLTGVGENFSAGGDAGAIVERIDSGDERALLDLMRSFHRLVEAVWLAEVPVIAAVSGVAYGGGFNLALACDLVVCAPDARFCQVFLRRGLVPDIGGAWLLPRLVGLQRAKELMLLTPEIGAARAERLGIVNAVVDDPVAHAVELGTQLAERSRLGVALTKKLVNASTSGDLRTALELEAVTQTVALGGARAGFEQYLKQ